MRGLDLWLALAGSALGPPPAPRVLFIGNSYTYFNDLPAMVAELGRAGGHPIETAMIVEGGASLERHLTQDSSVATIRRGGWTHVVLQEQSQLGNLFYIDGTAHIVDDGRFLGAIAELDRLVRDQRGVTVLFRHWSRRAADSGDRIRLAAAFDRVEDSIKPRSAPIAAAWDSVTKRLPTLPLYIADGSHPTAVGSYLTALVLYATITGESPVGLPGAIHGQAVDGAGQPTGNARALLIELDSTLAGALQRIALAVTRNPTRAATRPSPPPVPARPRLPAGDPIRVARLSGRWTGRAAVVPLAVTMDLGIDTDAAGPRVRVTFIAGTNRIGGKPIPLAVGKDRFSFTLPNGIQGLPMVFEGVVVGESLEGTVRVDDDATRFHAYGSWTVRRAATDSTR